MRAFITSNLRENDKTIFLEENLKKTFKIGSVCLYVLFIIA